MEDWNGMQKEVAQSDNAKQYAKQYAKLYS